MVTNHLIQYLSKFLLLHRPTSYRPPEIVRIFFVLLSSFATIIALEATFKYSPVFIKHSTPIIVPSWAATVILTCNALESPLGQPFNLFFGTFFSSILGIGLTKVWMLSGANEDTLWVCGALALALSSIMMMHLQMIHPAAGSAALLAAISPPIREMGWFYLVVQIVIALIVMGVGAIFANIYAQYPLYYFRPPQIKQLELSEDVSKPKEQILDFSFASKSIYVERGADFTTMFSLTPTSTASTSLGSISAPIPLTDDQTRPRMLGNVLTHVLSKSHCLTRIPTSSEASHRFAKEYQGLDLEPTALVSSSGFSFPTKLSFTQEDRGILVSIQRKLAALALEQAKHTA